LYLKRPHLLTLWLLVEAAEAVKEARMVAAVAVEQEVC
jgi:hypothetical protein